MPERLSLLTEERVLAENLYSVLIHAGFEVQVLSTAPRFWQRTRGFMSGLLIVDLDSMGDEPLAQCRRLRSLTTAHILAISQARGEQELVDAFRAGVDEYMVKPISESELVARVEALLRRRPNAGGFRISRVPICQDVVLDTDNRTLLVRGRHIKLTPIEYSLLDCLVSHAGEVVSRGTLLHQVWGHGKTPSVGSLNLYIYYLRRKIKHDPRHPEHILTRWGVGYYLSAGPSPTRQSLTSKPPSAKPGHASTESGLHSLSAAGLSPG